MFEPKHLDSGLKFALQHELMLGMGMSGMMWWLAWVLAVLSVLAWGENLKSMPVEPSDANLVKKGKIVPPRVVQPCKPGSCPFAGQRVRAIVIGGLTIEGPLMGQDGATQHCRQYHRRFVGWLISKYSKAPEATCYLLALMATKEKSQGYAARGWDGIDPGRIYHFLPPEGTAQIEIYLKAGWNEVDIRDFSKMCCRRL